MVSPTGTAVISLLLICLLLFVVLRAVADIEGRDKWYEDGWRDCESYHDHFGMTPDDELVLKQLKSAIRAHIKAKGYWRSGDMKKLDRTENFDELRHLVWEICIARRER